MLKVNRRVVALTLAFILSGAWPGANFQSFAQEPIPMKDGYGKLILQVSPNVALEPCEMRVSVTIPQHEDNRILIIMWLTKEGVVGLSQKDLNGAEEQVPHNLTVQRVMAGHYIVRALVIRAEEEGPVSYKAEEPLIVASGRRGSEA